MTSPRFFSCGTLSPRENLSLEKSGDSLWKTSAFYLDSSGRSRLPLALQLKFPSQQILNNVLATECMNHLDYCSPDAAVVKNGAPTEEDDGNNNNNAVKADEEDPSSNKDGSQEEKETGASSVRYSLGIEAKVTLTFGTGEAISATVESVTIQSYSVNMENSCIYFNTEINLHVSRTGDGGCGDPLFDSITATSSKAATTTTSSSSSAVADGVKLNIEIAAVLWEKFAHRLLSHQVSTGLRNLYVGRLSSRGTTTATGGGGGGGGSGAVTAHRQALQTRVSAPFSLQVALTHALSITARSIPAGPNMGVSLVSLTIRHSNTHDQRVGITNIALHPAFSHETTTRTSTKRKNSEDSNEGDESSVIDMSKSVQWGFAPKSDAQLPLSLGPHEAYSTILTVKSLGGSRCQTFSSPVSVTAVVSKYDSSGSGNENGDGQRHHSDRVVAEVDVGWTSGAAAVERSNAFRVNMSLPKEECVSVGASFAVSLEVFNLSTDLRNMNLVVANKNAKAIIKKNAPEQQPVDDHKESAGLAGLVLKEDSYCDELLAIDDSLSLGEFRGLSSNKAELRFVPLRAGTLTVPNFGLVDKGTGKLYQCMHNLQVVSQE